MYVTPQKIVESGSRWFICSSASLKNNKIFIFGKSSLDIAEAIRLSLSVDVSRYSENSDLFVCRDKCYQRLIKFQRASDKLKAELKQEIEEVFSGGSVAWQPKQRLRRRLFWRQNVTSWVNARKGTLYCKLETFVWSLELHTTLYVRFSHWWINWVKNGFELSVVKPKRKQLLGQSQQKQTVQWTNQTLMLSNSMQPTPKRRKMWASKSRFGPSKFSNFRWSLIGDIEVYWAETYLQILVSIFYRNHQATSPTSGRCERPETEFCSNVYWK